MHINQKTALMVLWLGLIAMPLDAAKRGRGDKIDDPAPAQKQQEALSDRAEHPLFLLCKDNHRSLQEQFPGLVTGEVSRQPPAITSGQRDALNAAVEVLKKAISYRETRASSAALHACDRLADDAISAILSVVLPDDRTVVMTLAESINGYNDARGRIVTATGAPMPRLCDLLIANQRSHFAHRGEELAPCDTKLNSFSDDVLCNLSSFMTAQDASALSRASKRMFDSNIIDKRITRIAREIDFLSVSTILTPEIKKNIAREIFRLNAQPGANGQYAIPPLQSFINQYSDQLAQATSLNKELAISELKKLVRALITLSELPYETAIQNAMEKFAVGTTLDGARAILAIEPDVMERLIMCLAWRFNFPESQNLAPDLDLIEAISETGTVDDLGISIDFECVPRELSSAVFNCILAYKKPTSLLCYHFKPAQLTINSNSLTGLDVFQTTKLARLRLNTMQLENLQLIDNNWEITDLNLSHLSELKMLTLHQSMSVNRLSFLHNRLLKDLDIQECCDLKLLDISQNTLLENVHILDCESLAGVDFSANKRINYLDLQDCTALRELNVRENRLLTKISTNGCSKLTELDLSQNSLLSDLDIEECARLTRLDISGNPLLVDFAADDSAIPADELEQLEAQIEENRSRIAAGAGDASGEE